MNKIKKLGILFFILIIPISSGFSETPMFDKVLDKVEKWDEAYGKALNKDTSEKQSKAIDDLTDEILKIVGQSEAVELKNEIVELREKKAKLQEDIADKQEELLTAPSEKSFWQVWETTREDLEEQIADDSSRISDIDYQIMDNKSAIQDLFMSIGVTLSSSDIDIITGDSYGNDVLNLLIVGQNINAILNQYRDNIIEIQGTSQSIPLALKYYQLYRLSVVSQIRALDIALDNLTVYQRRLNSLINENAVLMKNTQQKILTDSNNKKSYEANLSSQKISESVMTDFKALLKAYEDSWKEKRLELVRLRDMVQNTIDTVSISDEVSTMIGETQTMINTLNSVQIGEILPFDNSGLEKQFEELSLSLSEK